MGPVFGSGSESCQGSEKEKVIFKFFFISTGWFGGFLHVVKTTTA